MFAAALIVTTTRPGTGSRFHEAKGKLVNYLRSFGLLTTALFVLACGGGGTATTAPATPAAVTPPAATPAATVQPTAPSATPPATATPTEAATEAPTVAPGSSLDPSASDAGVVARVTITNDTRGDRDGTHEIIGIADDGSYCSSDFSEPTYTAVAWYDDAPNGKIHRFSVSVPLEDVLEEDGTVSDITDGRVSFDFVSESGFGTQYDGDASDTDHPSSVTMDVVRSGDGVAFSFQGTTWDDVNFEGQLICADAHR